MDTEKTCNATYSVCGTWERARVPAATRNSINEAYFFAANNDVIQVKASNKTENVSFQFQINVTLVGGYDCNFVRVKGAYSVITGLVTIKYGSVIFDRIMIMQKKNFRSMQQAVSVKIRQVLICSLFSLSLPFHLHRDRCPMAFCMPADRPLLTYHIA